MRVGQRPLQRVVVALQRLAERRQVRVQHFEAARIVLRQRRAARDDVKRGLLLRPGLRHHERAVIEVDRQQADLAWDFAARGLPAETAGNHQVKDQEQLAFTFQHDAFAEAMERDNLPPFDRRKRRIDRSKQERAREPDAGDALPDDARRQRVEIEQDVREFRHRLAWINHRHM